MSVKTPFGSQRLPKLLYRYVLTSLVSLNDPFWKKVVISRITLRADLHVAHLFYTFFGSTSLVEVQKLIQKKQYHLKQHLSKRWPLKRLPQLVFVYDQQGLKQERVWTLLHKKAI